MLGKIPSYLPKNDVALYRVLSFLCYLLFFFILVYGAMSFLFPYQRYSFDFNNPDATKNNLFAPHLTTFAPVVKGKVPALVGLVAFANNPQVLEFGDITIYPSDALSDARLEGNTITVRRGFAATFLSMETSLATPQKNIVEYQGNFYERQGDVLHPFVSQAAAESHIPKNKIVALPPEVFTPLKKSDELLGFRPGTMLAYADGVFFVTEEGTIRPFGSAQVLLRSGYTFDHVIPASGEDVGIYKRGKIILTDQLHLGGTLFYDTDTDTVFLFQNEKLWPLTPGYAEFLKTKNDVIAFSAQERNQESFCTLSKKFLQNAYACRFSALTLRGKGNDYQITLASTPQQTDIQTVTVGLQSSRQKDNAYFTLKSLFYRIVARLGLY